MLGVNSKIKTDSIVSCFNVIQGLLDINLAKFAEQRAKDKI